MKIVGRIIGFSILGFALLFLGTCYFQNCRDKSGPEPPAVKYEVVVKASNNHLYSDNVTVMGEGDKQIVTMDGYYESSSGKFVFRNLQLSLDETYFGEIEVKLK